MFHSALAVFGCITQVVKFLVQFINVCYSVQGSVDQEVWFAM